jgi:hypothetical protein
MALFPACQRTDLRPSFEIDSPPHVSENITNMPITRRSQVMPTRTESEWLASPKQDYTKMPTDSIPCRSTSKLHKDDSDSEAEVLDLTARFRQRMRAAMTSKKSMAVTRTMDDFNLTEHLKQVVSYEKTHPRLRRGPLVKVPRPRHPLANELAMSQWGKLIPRQDQPVYYKLIPNGINIEGHIYGRGIQLTIKLRCPLDQRAAICGKCGKRYLRNEQVLGFEVYGLLCYECCIKKIEDRHRAIERKYLHQKISWHLWAKNYCAETTKQSWSWFKRQLKLASDDLEETGKNSGPERDQGPPGSRKTKFNTVCRAVLGTGGECSATDRSSQ